MLNLFKKEVLSKEIINKIWELSKELIAKSSPAALEKQLRELESDIIPKIAQCICIFIDTNHSGNYWEEKYYNYWRIYSPKGKYLFSLPATLELPESEWDYIGSEVVTPSDDDSKSRNGGHYSSGFRIYKLKHSNIELYKTQFSWALFSDFEDQCSNKPEFHDTYQTLVETIGCDIDLTNL